MKFPRTTLLTVLGLSALMATSSLSPAVGAESSGASTNAVLESHLEALRPLLEKTWRGTFKNSRPEKPVVDVMRWERALNGKAVRLTHSINEGAYGGETIFMWDPAKQVVGYHYFSTAGFMSTGTIKFEDGKFITYEVVTGNAGGVTEVRGTSSFQADGTFLVKTEHLKDGKWDTGRETSYKEDATAKVIFR